MRVLRLALVVLSLLAVGFTVVSVAHADEVEEEARRIGRQLQCPVCNGVSVADSPSELAGQMRNVIRRKLEAGESPQAIVDYFVTRYGDGVLIEPPRRGIGLVVWLGPVVILALGVLILVRVVRAWLRPRWALVRAEVSPAPPHANGAAAPAGGALLSTLDRAQAELERFRREA